MPTTTGLTSEQLKAKIDELKGQGKTESTSKSLGKYVDAYKVLNPNKYGDSDVASAQKKLSSSTQAPSSGLSGLGGGNISALEKQLADRQKAVSVAMGNINDNPFYSEATRVGKLAKLQEQSALDISNLNQQIAQQRADQQLAFQMEQARKPNVQTVTDNYGNVTLFDETGRVINTIKGVGSMNASLLNGGNGTGDGDIYKYLMEQNAQQTGQPAGQTAGQGALQSPPMSAPAGTETEYPQGSGMIWTMGSDGRWF